MTGASRFEVGLTAALALIIALAVYDYILAPPLDDWIKRMTAWRDRQGSAEVQDAAELDEEEDSSSHTHIDDDGVCTVIGCPYVLRNGQWVEPFVPTVPPNHYIDGDGDMHPIEEEVSGA